MPDANLTHYVEDVDLPADALQLVRVAGTTASGEPALLGAYINIPAVDAAGLRRARPARRGAAAHRLDAAVRYATKR